MIHLFKQILIAITIIALFAFFNPVKVEKWIIVNGCTLSVSGSTNINKFVCEVVQSASADTINHYNYDAARKYFPLSGMMYIDVTGFNCHNPVMTADLRKTLKYKEFPRLKVNFISLQKLPDPKNKKEKITGLVDIELSGVRKRFEIDYEFRGTPLNEIQVVGTKQILFSDFNLIPPRKLGGMIKTNNELFITFDITLKSI